MPEVGFEPMITAFERAKTVHALDRAATLICGPCLQPSQFSFYTLQSCKCSQHLPPERWYPPMRLHGVTTHKIKISTITVFKTAKCMSLVAVKMFRMSSFLQTNVQLLEQQFKTMAFCIA
jgi:hypothetical protein